MLARSLENCGKYLDISGKLATIGGLNIVNFTKVDCKAKCLNQCARFLGYSLKLAARYDKVENTMPKRTYQPKKRHRAREHGFMKRMANRAGKAVLRRRRQKGRARLTH